MPASFDPSSLSVPSCPICNGPARVRQRHAVNAVAAAHAPPARDVERHQRMRDAIARLWPAGFVEVCVCERCQLGFAWPLVGGDAAFYALLHERVGYPHERWEFARTRHWLGKSSARVLDVGAGRGDFLASLPSTIERHGIEASAAMRNELSSRGIVAHASLDDAARAGPFTLVTMFHVLQYFADPVEALRQAAAMLAPAKLDAATSNVAAGRLAISLGNAAIGGDRLDRIAAPPHPLTRWTPRALECALEAAGLAMEQFEWIPTGPMNLLWAANTRTRERAATHPGSMAARIDAMRPGKLRTGLLAGQAIAHLPSVLMHARQRLTRAQAFTLAVCK